MNTLKVKICGMRDPENIQEIAKLPVDIMGFIFYPGSPRFVKDAELLASWLEKGSFPASIARAGVFVNAEIEVVLNAIHDFELDYVQLHGNESSAYCKELLDIRAAANLRNVSIIKAFSVGDDFSFRNCKPFEPYCSLFLFDTKTPAYGGSGEVFDWAQLQRYDGQVPFMLSGGIGPGHIGNLKEFAHPRWAGIDLNSRLETSPGQKNAGALEQFLRELGRLEVDGNQ